MPEAALCCYFFERVIVLDEQALRQQHALFLYKGKNIVTGLLPESNSETSDAHTGFNGQAFSSYFLMEVVYDKSLDIQEDGGIMCML